MGCCGGRKPDENNKLDNLYGISMSPIEYVIINNSIKFELLFKL